MSNVQFKCGSLQNLQKQFLLKLQFVPIGLLPVGLDAGDQDINSHTKYLREEEDIIFPEWTEADLKI